MNEIAVRLRLSDIVAEYDQKVANIAQNIDDFEKAGNNLKSSSCVAGRYGNEHIDTGRIHENTIKKSLLKSAWLHVYDGLQIYRIASAKDKKRFNQEIEKPAPFTMDNIRATFGDYILDQRGNILRGLAEVFCDLDPVYKSHDKMRIGVASLPKRVIISGCNSDWVWGADKIRDILNALAAYQNKPLTSRQEISALFENEIALLISWNYDNATRFPARGVRLRRFRNGNAHLFFERDTLLDINRALAEYYGEVLPDCSEDHPEKRRESTAITKDLQYYPTPSAVISKVLGNIHISKHQKVLEPSCGDGRIMDGIRQTFPAAHIMGIEIDGDRVKQARIKGHSVIQANFLETVPTGDYDYVIMNPPFYGQHYAKHVKHALQFLKQEGKLIAILPVTARYDHGLLDGEWDDLPVGSFRESGTNINTTIFTRWK